MKYFQNNEHYKTFSAEALSINNKVFEQLKKGDEVSVCKYAVSAHDNHRDVIRAIKIKEHNQVFTEDFKSRLIYTGVSDLFFMTGRETPKGRQYSSIRHLSVLGVIYDEDFNTGETVSEEDL